MITKIINFLFSQHHFSSIKKQQATDQLHFFIDSNYWNVNEPLPYPHELSELLDCNDDITMYGLYRLVGAGVIFEGENGRLYIRTTSEESH
ncbi:hypothetical protein [Marinobacter salicampi]|uniref:hypothetical protein n=1 Tax=Marinobacter salicampi TaxID=435907 RepID=UPI001408FB66|nr:hypothetical protein [Marinobacter salicampi]